MRGSFDIRQIYYCANVLMLRGRGIGDVQLARIINWLKNVDIRFLDLSENEITDDGIIELSKILREKRILALKINGNKFGEKGAGCILKALMGTEVRKLAFGWERIIKDPKYLERAKCYIREVDVRLLNAYDDKIPLLLSAILKYTNIENLDLSYAKLSCFDINKITLGVKGSKIKTLDISNSALYDEGLPQMICNLEDSDVSELKIKNCKTTYNGMLGIIDLLGKTKIEKLVFNVRNIDLDQEEELLYELREAKLKEVELNGVRYRFGTHEAQLIRNERMRITNTNQYMTSLF